MQMLDCRTCPDDVAKEKNKKKDCLSNAIVEDSIDLASNEMAQKDDISMKDELVFSLPSTPSDFLFIEMNYSILCEMYVLT